MDRSAKQLKPFKPSTARAVTISFSVYPETLDAMSALANAHGMNRSALFAVLVAKAYKAMQARDA